MSSEEVKRVWRLDELAAHVAYVLSVLELVQSSGRVREVPDRRTIRYYTTLGLLSRPVGFRGRTALYGWEHIYQLVAIKRYQVKGLSLSEIQEALLGLPQEEVERMAAIPVTLQEELMLVDVPTAKESESQKETESVVAPVGGVELSVSEPRRSFWKQEPAPVSAPLVPSSVASRSRAAHSSVQMDSGDGQPSDDLASPPQVLRPASEGGAIVYQGVLLAEGLKLLLESPARALEEDDVEAIRVAAGPLLKVLAARHLLRAPNDGDLG